MGAVESRGVTEKEILEAVYEDGVFKPLRVPSGIREHGRVTLTVTDGVAPGSLADLHGVMPFADADEMREIVEREFGSIDSRDDRARLPVSWSGGGSVHGCT